MKHDGETTPGEARLRELAKESEESYPEVNVRELRWLLELVQEANSLAGWSPLSPWNPWKRKLEAGPG